jgi:TRAP-type C4-dicarboxylate transport system permease large subunit
VANADEGRIDERDHALMTRLYRFVELATKSFWIALIAVVGLYGFMLVLGAFSPAEAGSATVVLLVCVVLCTAHEWRMRLHHDEVLHDPRLKAARERRGF